jgi:outer membrane receptor protein involved in Fe transport
LSSFLAFAQSHNPADLVIADNGVVKPEKVQTIEVGYRGMVTKKFGVDFSVYYNAYNDFQMAKRVIALASEVGNVNDATAMNAIGTGAFKPFYLYSNSEKQVHSYGLDVGFNYKFKNFKFGLIYDYAKLDFDEADSHAGFNTPEHRVKFSVGNDKVIKNLGFNVNFKYQTEFLYEASFTKFAMIPARALLDAQINYNVKKYNTRIKIGGTNLLGKEYLPAPGTGMIGTIYYVGLTYGK